MSRSDTYMLGFTSFPLKEADTEAPDLDHADVDRTPGQLISKCGLQTPASLQGTLEGLRGQNNFNNSIKL